MSGPESRTLPGVLLVDADILVRHVLAEYLRGCGYRVVEAASSDEARSLLAAGEVEVDVVLADVQAPGQVSGFTFARWLREAFPHIDVVVAGAPAQAAKEAAGLCESGPHLARPYEPEQVVDYIKRLRASRDRAAVP